MNRSSKYNTVRYSIFCLFLFCLHPLALAGAADYCVVSLVNPDDPYQAAVNQLQEIHDGTVLQSDVDSIDQLVTKLRKISPSNVAVVIRPEDFDINLVRRFMQIATRIDDDPFIDFAYGFITGKTPREAVALVKAGQISKPKTLPASVMLGVSGGQMAKSVTHDQRLPLRGASLRQTSHFLAATKESAAGKAGSPRDQPYLEKVMPTLDGTPILVFAGHGYPSEVVGGPTYEHLKGRRFDGSVALNIACYTGITNRWYQDDWQAMTITEKKVPPEQSFCLNMLSTGVAGYVAYACPRPAGPTMLGEAITMATSGESLGELRRRRGNDVVMTHLQLGSESLRLPTVADGDPIKANRNVQDLLTELSTGGVLFGDPACRPFKRSEDVHPIQTKVTADGNELVVRVEVFGPLWHFFCRDQILMWDDKANAMRIETTIPLGKRFVSDVELLQSAFGKVPHRLIAVTEQHAGTRLLHIKATFATPEIRKLTSMGWTGVFGQFQVTTSDTGNDSKIIRKGGIRPVGLTTEDAEDTEQ